MVQEVQTQVGKVRRKVSQWGVYVTQLFWGTWFNPFVCTISPLRGSKMAPNNKCRERIIYTTTADVENFHGQVLRFTTKNRRRKMGTNRLRYWSSAFLPILSGDLETCKFIQDTPEPSCTSQFTRQVWTTKLILSLMKLIKASNKSLQVFLSTTKIE